MWTEHKERLPSSFDTLCVVAISLEWQKLSFYIPNVSIDSTASELDALSNEYLAKIMENNPSYSFYGYKLLWYSFEFDEKSMDNLYETVSNTVWKTYKALYA